MAEAEKIYAEARRLHAETEGIELDNIPKRRRAGDHGALPRNRAIPGRSVADGHRRKPTYGDRWRSASSCPGNETKKGEALAKTVGRLKIFGPPSMLLVVSTGP